MADRLSEIYLRRKTEFENDLLIEERKSNLLSWLRLITFLVAISLAILGWYSRLPKFIFWALPLIILFLFLIVKHQRVKTTINYLNNLIDINQSALLRLSAQWTGFLNTGKQFLESDHPYTTDLNIFGQGSLFQYIDSTTSYIGEQTLAKWFSVLTDFNEIKPRQQAMKELAQKLDWRQHFQATGMQKVKQSHNLAKLLAWAEEKPRLLNRRYSQMLWLLPFVTLVCIILSVFQFVTIYLPMVLLAFHLLIVVWGEIIVRKAFGETGKAIVELGRYAELLECIEREGFQAPLLVNLKGKLIKNNCKSSHQIKVLAKIADRNNFRYSPVFHFIINVAVFWDLRTLWKMENWKRKSGRFLGTWIGVVGEFEALSSLAILAHDNPDWVFPEVIDSPPILEATSLGHPLISNEFRVCNNVSLPTPGTILIITGSNMSGKSTFLRTIGINLVLAYAGAPVCAEAMRCSVMNIYSGMQIQDNLENKTSTFYAELKRIKMLIDAAEMGKPIMFLLDEILKGTNSNDRIFGAKTLIRKLVALPAIGLITTHDLELGTLEKENPILIKNFHFTDQIDSNKISFDYRLKKGISQRTNAIALMKLIGIEVE